MNYSIVTIQFKEPLRSASDDGEPKEGYFASDSLWSAIFAAHIRLHGSLLSVDPKETFRVSSMFPYCNEVFLPKPRVTPPPKEQDTQEKQGPGKKEVKNLHYVDLETFKHLSRGNKITEDKLKTAQDKQNKALKPVQVKQRYIEEKYEKKHDNKKFQNENIKASGKLERQHNTQDRITQATETFYKVSVLQPEMYFILQTHSQEQKNSIEQALNLLADEGLGGKRTYASGQFIHKIQDCPPELLEMLNSDAKKRILLSLTHLTKQEAMEIADQDEEYREDKDNAQYTLVLRDGYLDGTMKQRKKCWMLSEGSYVLSPVDGMIVDVTPENHSHKVWRSGLAITVGVE